ncbi:c-type cytochrome [Shewanella colwelliana]|uniref:Cytochrome c n=1 Tax=Shewanella colwelliana TaxID=23 RepID=A0ABQ4P2S5_SHECO|nr:cytochrome c [Shewanella colwelliana]MCZ4336239.1 cytochrome c [Shewanella colwelliana]MDX1280606.1 cytochrome c [Shewanella colwelliana]GIU35229.1 cytochrome c [Shewanella colwelliana]GIU41826.1 cytochrome c [Shewanella colwelliana]
MKKQLKLTLLAIAATAVTATAVHANNFKESDDAIHYRQSAFGLIAHNFGDMGAMLKGKKPFDAEVFAMRAQNVAALSQLPAEGFVAGSDKGETEALAKIWAEKTDFDAKMTAFQDNAAKLAIAAKSEDKDAIKAAFMNTGKSCKGCHDVYKKD